MRRSRPSTRPRSRSSSTSAPLRRRGPDPRQRWQWPARLGGQGAQPRLEPARHRPGRHRHRRLAAGRQARDSHARQWRRHGGRPSEGLSLDGCQADRRHVDPRLRRRPDPPGAGDLRRPGAPATRPVVHGPLRRRLRGLPSDLESGTLGPRDLRRRQLGARDFAIFDSLNAYVEDGGRLILHTWVVEFDPGHPLWARLGFSLRESVFDVPRSVHWWQPEHPAFTFPEIAPEPTELDGWHLSGSTASAATRSTARNRSPATRHPVRTKARRPSSSPTTNEQPSRASSTARTAPTSTRTASRTASSSGRTSRSASAPASSPTSRGCPRARRLRHASPSAAASR